MTFNRQMYDALERKQVDYLVNILNKVEEKTERQTLLDIIRVISDHYLYKRQIIDYMNDCEKSYVPKNYDEM